jgi:phosphotriesterase-related protein
MPTAAASVERTTHRVVQTVQGPVEPSSLGVVLPHEHVFFDLRARFSAPTGFRSGSGHERVSLANVGRIRFAQRTNVDNLHLDDVDDAIAELEIFKGEGGGTIVDLSPASNGRSVEKLRKVSEATGVHAVVGTGYYVDEFLTDEVNASGIDALAAVLIDELTDGIDGTDVRAGIIGEVGCSWPLTDRERASLTASAIAQQQTGAAISIHPGRTAAAPAEIVSVLRLAGADLSRVVMGHLDRTYSTVEQVLELADSGVYLEFDLFGQESSHVRYGDIELPSDMGRLRMISDVVRHGFGDKVLVSHDLALKHHLETYGGHGYAHLLRRVVPRMPEVGLTQEQIDRILRGNPAQVLSRAV